MDIRTRDILELEEYYSACRHIQNVARGYAATFAVLVVAAALYLASAVTTNFVQTSARDMPSQLVALDGAMVAVFLAIYLIAGLPAVVTNRVSAAISLLLIGLIVAAVLSQAFDVAVQIPAAHGLSLGVLVCVAGGLMGLGIVGSFFLSLLRCLLRVLWRRKVQPDLRLDLPKIRSRWRRGQSRDAFGLHSSRGASGQAIIVVKILAALALLLEMFGGNQLLLYATTVVDSVANSEQIQAAQFHDAESRLAPLATIGVLLLVGSVLPYPCYKLSSWFRRLARRLIRRSLETSAEKDQRAPVLLVHGNDPRVFDLPRAPRSNFLMRALSDANRIETFGDLVTVTCWGIGPVISVEASANGALLSSDAVHDDGAAPDGAIKGPLEAARVVVVALDVSDAVTAAVENAMSDTGLRDKLILVIPPRRHRDADFLTAVLKGSRALREALPAGLPESTVAIVPNRTGYTILTCPDTTSQTFDVVVRLGVVAALGGESAVDSA